MPNQLTAGRAACYGKSLLLNQMDSEAAELFLQVDGDGLAVLDGHILVVVELHAQTLELVDGALDGVGADGDVTQLASLG